MGDPVIFTAFVTNILGANIQQAQQAQQGLVSCISTFRLLMEISEGEFSEFIKQVHSANSSRVAAQRIIYNPIITTNLKVPITL